MFIINKTAEGRVHLEVPKKASSQKEAIPVRGGTRRKQTKKIGLES